MSIIISQKRKEKIIVKYHLPVTVVLIDCYTLLRYRQKLAISQNFPKKIAKKEKINRPLFCTGT
jgi:hypothetical protein